jgi:hypothetical protein
MIVDYCDMYFVVFHFLFELHLNHALSPHPALSKGEGSKRIFKQRTSFKAPPFWRGVWGEAS